MACELSPGLPWDIRLLLTGYLPGYLYRIGVLDHRLSLAQWRARADITARACLLAGRGFLARDSRRTCRLNRLRHLLHCAATVLCASAASNVATGTGLAYR